MSVLHFVFCARLRIAHLAALELKNNFRAVKLSYK